MHKLVYLGLSILDISKTSMLIWLNQCWYGYIKPKYQNNTKLCYRDTGSFIIVIKTADIYTVIADDNGKWYDTSNCEVDRPLLKLMDKKAIGLMKDELGRKINIEFVALRSKTYSYSTDAEKIVKKSQRNKKCVIKRILKFNDYINCLFKTEIMLKS